VYTVSVVASVHCQCTVFFSFCNCLFLNLCTYLWFFLYLHATYAASWYCFWQCLSVCTKSWKLQDRNGCNSVRIWPKGNTRSRWKLMASDLDSFFVFFPPQAILYEWLYLATSFSVRWYIFRISRSRFSFKVIGPRSRSQQWKSSSVQLKNYWLEIAGAWSEYLLRYCSK